MSRLSKIVFILLFAISACAKPVVVPDNNDFLKVTPDPLKAPIGNKVMSPVEINVSVENPLTITPVEIIENRLNGIVIDGLKDETVEALINLEIRAMVEQYWGYRIKANLPPYYGLAKRLASNGKPEAESYRVDVYVTYNADNILSVQVEGDYFFKPLESAGQGVKIIDGMTFDLSSGKQLSISDLVSDNADASKLFSPWIYREVTGNLSNIESSVIDWHDQYLLQIAPFKGMRGSQNFYITSNAWSSKGIVFVLDYRTPEFDTRLAPYQFTVNFADIEPDLAIFERFKTSATLFTQPISSKLLVELISRDPIRFNESLTKNGVVIYRSTSYPDNRIVIAPEILAMIQPSLAKIDAKIGVAQKSMGIVSRAYESVDIKKAGRFTSIVTTLVAYQLKDPVSEYNGESYMEDIGPRYIEREVIVFDETMKRIELKDLFVEGYDYAKMIKNAIEDPWLNSAYNAYMLHGYDIGNRRNELYANLAFSLSQDYLILYSYLVLPDGTKPSFSIGLKYKDIGINNLTIFN